MKSSALMPALLAIVARAATVPPASDQSVTVPDAVLDAAISDPLVNYVDGPVAGADPSALLPPGHAPSSPDESGSPSAPPFAVLDDDDPAVAVQAWAAIELEAAAALGASSADPDDGDDENAERLADVRARGLGEVAKGPSSGGARPAPVDFHRGVTKDQLCSYFRGIAWKTGELQRPVYQWQYEYVPWLIHNKGPYIHVLDGLRHIEWILWKIERALQYTTIFTPDEERDIIRCYYQFSGFERQLPRVPVVVRPATAAAGEITTPAAGAELEDAAGKPPVKRPIKTPVKPPVKPNSIPALWGRPFPSLKKLLRIITVKAPVSKYQSYANHRIQTVLINLDRSAIGAAKGLIDKFQSPAAKAYILYDVNEGQGLAKAFKQAISAYDAK